MMHNDNPYIEERDGDYYVSGQRVPLISLVYVWNNGSSPETIRQKFPVLTLAEVYGAIAYYIDHREVLDQHFVKIREEEDAIAAHLAETNADFRTELERRFVALKLQDKASAS